jgi:tight adherence protein C
MMVAVVLGALAGLAGIGVLRGFRTTPMTLESVAGAMKRPAPDPFDLPEGPGVSRRAGRSLATWFGTPAFASHPRWLALGPSLAITGQSPEGLASKVLVATGAGLLGPPLLWAAAQAAGLGLAPAVPILLAIVATPVGACLPVAELLSRARDRRRHVRIVLGSFVDLVVLSLAGGVGVEGALMAASQVSEDWAARRMARSLSLARDRGLSPWEALARLGEEIDVPDLVELATTLELAGTEGARIRQSLSSRAVSLRRHEQADAESAANAVTERLFLPGALLLVGFLLFIGYPAFSRIIGGF